MGNTLCPRFRNILNLANQKQREINPWLDSEVTSSGKEWEGCPRVSDVRWPPPRSWLSCVSSLQTKRCAVLGGPRNQVWILWVWSVNLGWLGMSLGNPALWWVAGVQGVAFPSLVWHTSGWESQSFLLHEVLKSFAFHGSWAKETTWKVSTSSKPG